ncbi:MAG: hypothetical protein MJ195_02720 [Mycoplasmoidaceae bacterium]|nr:hypothetical protein [Mycoplasmoidaceae bacterium]
MEDRSFSLLCYKDAGASSVPYTQSAFILAKNIAAEKAGRNYEYYVATT